MSELHVLLVDDNEDDRFLTSRMLRKLPLPVRLEVARDGVEALCLLQGSDAAPPPSLVILDLQLPRVSGAEVLERLRAVPETRDIPVVVVSASGHPMDLDRCRELGANAYLTKPLDAGQLHQVIAAL